MKKLYAILFVSAFLLGLAASAPAMADRDHDHYDHRPHGRVGIGFFYDPFWFSPSLYYPPAVVAVPVQPPTYIERSDSEAAAPGSGYWYYCEDPKGYYPYVKQCPGGWQPVSPQPPTEK